jgi:hypothetical protein
MSSIVIGLPSSHLMPLADLERPLGVVLVRLAESGGQVRHQDHVAVLVDVLGQRPGQHARQDRRRDDVVGLRRVYGLQRGGGDHIDRAALLGALDLRRRTLTLLLALPCGPGVDESGRRVLGRVVVLVVAGASAGGERCRERHGRHERQRSL